jgi:uncharacterized surface protein with fasciclin (FAS1) repeats
MNAADIKAIKAGKATLKQLVVELNCLDEREKLYITDENGTMSEITIADVNQSNGVIHVVDTVYYKTI